MRFLINNAPEDEQHKLTAASSSVHFLVPDPGWRHCRVWLISRRIYSAFRDETCSVSVNSRPHFLRSSKYIFLLYIRHMQLRLLNTYASTNSATPENKRVLKCRGLHLYSVRKTSGQSPQDRMRNHVRWTSCNEKLQHFRSVKATNKYKSKAECMNKK